MISERVLRDFNHMLTTVLGDVLEHKVANQVYFDKDLNSLVFEVQGFYKYGIVRLVCENFKVVGHTRYDEKHDIENAYDLADLNYSKWQDWKHRNEGWGSSDKADLSPDADWLPILLKHGLVKQTMETKAKYE